MDGKCIEYQSALKTMKFWYMLQWRNCAKRISNSTEGQKCDFIYMRSKKSDLFTKSKSRMLLPGSMDKRIEELFFKWFSVSVWSYRKLEELHRGNVGHYECLDHHWIDQKGLSFVLFHLNFKMTDFHVF